MPNKLMDEEEIFKRHFIQFHKAFYNKAVAENNKSVKNAKSFAAIFNSMTPEQIEFEGVLKEPRVGHSTVIISSLFTSLKQKFQKIDLANTALFNLKSEEDFKNLAAVRKQNEPGIYKIKDRYGARLVILFSEDKTPSQVFTEGIKFTTPAPYVNVLNDTIGFAINDITSITGFLGYSQLKGDGGASYDVGEFITIVSWSDGTETIKANPNAVGGTIYNFRNRDFYVINNLTDFRDVVIPKFIALPNQDTDHHQKVELTDVDGVKKMIDLNSVVTTRLTNTYGIFNGATAFNQAVGSWDMSNFTNLNNTFSNAKAFNQDLSRWDTSSVVSASSMFSGADSFNQPIGGWDTGNMNNVYAMFQDAKAFNQPIGEWDTSSVLNASRMFRFATAFNQDLSEWDMGYATNLTYMFNGATAFNQDLSKWCVSGSPTLPSSFDTGATDWELPRPNWGTCNLIEDPADPTFEETEFIGFITHADGGKTVYAKEPAVNDTFYYAGNQWYFVASPVKFNEITTQFAVIVDQENTKHSVLIKAAGGEQSIPLNNVVTTRVVTLYRQFVDSPTFNQDISQWDTSNVLNFRWLFANTTAFNQPIGNWNVSKVTNMSSMFQDAKAFNQDISRWDTSKVTTMYNTFNGATSFNGDIGDWDLGEVTDTFGMFQNAKAFNQDISRWDVSKVTTMYNMFNGAESFDQNIGPWDVDNVTNMGNMFSTAKAFNQDLSEWCVGRILTLPSGFDYLTDLYVLPRPGWGTCNPRIPLEPTYEETEFIGFTLHADGTRTVYAKEPAVEDVFYEAGNQWYYVAPQSKWPAVLAQFKSFTPDIAAQQNHSIIVSAKDEDRSVPLNNVVTTRLYSISGAFDPSPEFNQDISQWDTSNVTNMSRVFFNAPKFNQDIGNWNVSKVTNMSSMFQDAKAFNQDIGRWDTGKVTTMTNMFNGNTVFNQDIGNWDTGSVTRMDGMFQDAKVFNQDIGRWSMERVTNVSYMFRDSDFNQDIGPWNLFDVTSLNGMLYGAKVFNQDLSSWCVGNSPTPASSFDTGATAYVLPRPSWGTCNPRVPEEATYEETDFIGFTLHEDGIRTVYAKAGAKGDTFYEAGNQWYYVASPARMKPVVDQFGKTPDQTKSNNRAIVKGLNGSYDIPINNVVTTLVKSLNNILDGIPLFNQDISQWDVSNVTNMNYLFRDSNNFNRPIGNWDTSKVTTMNYMFANNKAFNQPIGRWDTSSVTNMSYMFNGATAFNQDISQWDVSSVTNTFHMFNGAENFNSELGDWDLNQVTNVSYMFANTTAFNQPLNTWNVSSVTNMTYMFNGAEAFNQDISQWEVGKVTGMTGMFQDAKVFNQDLSSWCVSAFPSLPSGFDTRALEYELPRPIWATCNPRVPTAPTFEETEFITFTTHADGGKTVHATAEAKPDTFYKAGNKWYYVAIAAKLKPVIVQFGRILDQEKTDHEVMVTGLNGTYPVSLNNVVTTKIVSLQQMFSTAININQDISQWDVSNVTNMNYLFQNANNFNRPIGNWDTSKVTTMNYMFQNAKAFNQDISRWDVSSVLTMNYIFSNNGVINPDVSKWKTTSLKDMSYAFQNNTIFNQGLNGWDTSNVTNMTGVFNNATAFNQPLNTWNVSSVTTMNNMFMNAKAFNQPLNTWDVSNVTGMTSMFNGAETFNQDLSRWCVTKLAVSPSSFDANTAEWVKSKPVWGTCP